jgi:hypothetical protein
MSNEVNIKQIGYGTLDPGFAIEMYSWTTSESAYKKQRKQARFFTVVPDPLLPSVPPGGGYIENDEGIVQMEITRVWNMVRTTVTGGANWTVDHVLQWNVALLNSGQQTASWELLQAETDN